MNPSALRRYLLFRALATSYLWEPVFVAFMRSRGLSFADVMMLSVVYSIAIIAVEVPTGMFADRVGRRPSMMLGAACLALAAIWAAHAYSLAAFAAAEVLLALSLALCSGADSAYLFDTLKQAGAPGQYARLESLSSAWHMAGTAAALLLGGLLAEADLTWPYFATAATATLCIYLAGSLPAEVRRPMLAVVRPGASAPSHPWLTRAHIRLVAWGEHLAAAWGDVTRNPRMLWLFGYSAVVFVLILACRYLYQPLLAARGFSTGEVGVVLAGSHVVAAAVAWNSHALMRRLGEEHLLWGIIALLSLSFALFEQTSGLWILALLALSAVAKGLYSPVLKPMLNREVRDSARRATVLSMESIVRRFAVGVFSPIAGLAGARASTYVCGIVGLLGIGLLAFYFAKPAASKTAENQEVDREQHSG